jgi:zinc protease
MNACGLLFQIAVLQTASLPSIPPGPQWDPPAPQEQTSSAGLRLWTLPKKGVPLVHVALTFPAGSYGDPAGKEGLSALTAAVLEEGGAGSRTGAAVLEAFDALGTSLSVEPRGAGVGFNFTVTSDRLDAALALLFDIVSAPRFEAAAFESVKKRQLAELVSRADEPQAVATTVLTSLLFPADARGHVSQGNTAAVRALTLDDVKQFYATRYGSAGATLVLVGDVKPEASKQRIDALAPKAWLKTPAPLAAFSKTASAPQVVAIDKPGAAQTLLVLGAASVAAGDPERPALREAAVILGGSFTSRLVQNLREKHGYTYGARASTTNLKDFGILTVSTSVRTQVTAEAIEQLTLELNQLGTLSEAEQAKSLALLGGELVDRFGSGALVARALTELAETGLPKEHLSQERTSLATVKKADAAASARRFESARLTWVLVGDKKIIEKSVAQKMGANAPKWVTAPAP